MNTTSQDPEFDISVSRLVPADPQAIWDVITDVSHMGELSPENIESRWLDDTRTVGSRFKGRNQLKWLRWTTVATVTAWEPAKRFSFESSSPSRTRWSYELEPVEGGTRVVESMFKQDQQAAPIRFLQKLVGVTDRAAVVRAGMQTTLERLEQTVA